MNLKHAISWFEIPATDLDRATRFYEQIFDIRMHHLDMQQIRMRLFPVEGSSFVGGAVVHSNGFHNPSSTDGPLIYLNGDPDLQQVLNRVEAAGGKISVPKTEISPEYGYMAIIIDTEGNRIGLHSKP
ncbi:MAG TPA: VOC family protein [Chitinophagaceae bacterium]